MSELTIVKVRYNGVLDRLVGQIRLTLTFDELGVLPGRPFLLSNRK